MSYADGWAAMNLEMPARVPRTEYSAAEYHWPLVRRVTGMDVHLDSPAELRRAATAAFRRAWTYDFCFDTPIEGSIFGNLRTRMGHAVYAEDGVDYDDKILCPFTDPEQVLSFDPEEAFGIPKAADIRAFLEKRYADSVSAYPDEVHMTGCYVSMMSAFIDLFGWDLLLTACGEDAARFGEAANRYARWLQHYFNAMAETDIPAVMVHDDMVWTSGAFIHPDWYRKYIFPNFARYIRPLLDAGKKVLFISDGNYTEFIDDIARCGFHGFVLEPMTDMAEIAQKYGRTHVFIGNADTRILLTGTPDAIRAEVKRCMDIGKSCPGFFLAVGNHIPANTPVESCLIYEEAYRKMCMR